MFLSLVRPDRISSPITRMAAVMTAAPDGSFILDPPAARWPRMCPDWSRKCHKSSSAAALAAQASGQPLNRHYTWDLVPLPSRHGHRYNGSPAESFDDLLL